MAVAKLSLQNLIQGIVGSVVDSQNKIRDFQLQSIKGYFDEQDRPRYMSIRMPSMAHNARAEDERYIQVPELSLVGAQFLNIKEMSIRFEVGLSTEENSQNENTEKTAGNGDVSRKADPPHKMLGVDMDAKGKRGPGMVARVSLKVENCPPTDGVARLIQHLDKLI